MVLEEVKLDELNKIFDENSKEVINYLLQRTVLAYPEFLPGQNDTALYLEKKQCEQWIVQALGLKPVGEGSYPIDGISDKNGYDVSSLAVAQTKAGLMNTQSGEKSLGQKFADVNFGEAGDNFDNLFQSSDYDKIILAWKKILKKKWNKAITDHNLENLYLVNLLLYKPKKKLYVVLFKINIAKINDMQKGKPSKASIFIKNFIDDELGNLKIYKSKKRMELRLKPREIIEKRKYFLSFNIDSKVGSKNLREILKNKNKKNKYLLKETKKFKKFFSKLKD